MSGIKQLVCRTLKQLATPSSTIAVMICLGTLRGVIAHAFQLGGATAAGVHVKNCYLRVDLGA